MPNEPGTVTMNVSLPEPLKQFVDGKVSSGVYGSASEFVREASGRSTSASRTGRRPA
jgi:putative addiction module CopG family antidote